MNHLNHPYFGPLDTDELHGIIWEQSHTLNGETFDVHLWGGNASDAEQHPSMLDAFAKFLQDLPAIDVFARQQLTHYLTEDAYFIEFHAEELTEGSDVMAQLLADANGGNISAAAFAAKMKLQNIGMWLDLPDAPIILDYMMEPENNDQILAVKLTLDYQLESIAWES